MLKILMGELAPVRGIRHAHRYLVGRAGGKEWWLLTHSCAPSYSGAGSAVVTGLGATSPFLLILQKPKNRLFQPAPRGSAGLEHQCRRVAGQEVPR